MESTNAYGGFASVYDILMDNVPYQEWSRYLTAMMRQNGVDSGIVLELGCGTGTMTRLLSRAGYDMIGIDRSPEMLQVAMEKETQPGSILYLCQDMCDFELYGTVEAAVSVCDSINYITDRDKLIQMFRLVNLYLEKDGCFIFDMNTRYKYETLLADGTFAEDRENVSFIWQNEFDRATGINEYDLSIFVVGSDGRYDKFQEIHYQRAYTLAEIRDCIRAGGMEFVDAYDAFSMDAPGPESERICVVAKEKFDPRKTYC